MSSRSAPSRTRARSARAARELALTQPAVSQQVAALERRSARGCSTATQRADADARRRVLLAHADAIAERLELAGTQLAELAGTPRLRIGAFPSALAGLVPAAVAPAALCSVEEGPTPELAERVRRGELHLARRVPGRGAGAPRARGLERRELLPEPFLVALPPGHRSPSATPSRSPSCAEDRWIAPRQR